MTSLKKNGLLRTYYRDRLRGYRLGAKAKAALLDGWPERFSPYLTGDTDTNRLKSEVNRRLRLHRLAETYVTMDNAGIGLFQDEKPKVFSPQGYHGEAIEYPAFYSSREVKEMGIDATPSIRNPPSSATAKPPRIFLNGASWRNKRSRNLPPRRPRPPSRRKAPPRSRRQRENRNLPVRRLPRNRPRHRLLPRPRTGSLPQTRTRSFLKFTT